MSIQITFRDVLVPHGWVGSIDKMAGYAKAIGYEYFLWNGRLFQNQFGAWVDTNLTESDIGR